MSSVIGSAKGSAGAAQSTAAAALDLVGPWLHSGVLGFDQYMQELEGLLSTDPSMRMEANAATIADINATAQGERAQVANLPRGGESAFLNAQIDQGAATAIGDALSKTFNQALGALGQAGEFATGESLSTILGAGELQVAAANAFTGMAGVSAGEWAGLENMISGLAQAGGFAYAAGAA